MFTIVCALPAAGAVQVALAQEDASLGEDLTTGILSNVLEDGGDNEENDDADTEIDQDGTNMGTVNPNQDQTVDQDDTVIFGDDTADIDDANIAVPIAIPINVDVDEEEEEVPLECPPGFTFNAATDECEQIQTQPPT